MWDYIFLGFLLWQGVAGLKRGLVGEILSCVIWIAALAIAFPSATWLASQSYLHIFPEAWRWFIAFGVCVGLGLLVGVFIQGLYAIVSILVPPGGMSRALGGALGLLRGCVILLIFIGALRNSPYTELPDWKASKVLQGLSPIEEILNPLLPFHNKTVPSGGHIKRPSVSHHI